MSAPEIAGNCGCPTHNSVYILARRWSAEGDTGLVSNGPSGADCRFSPKRLDRPADWPAPPGPLHPAWTSMSLHRMGFSPQGVIPVSGIGPHPGRRLLCVRPGVEPVRRPHLLHFLAQNGLTLNWEPPEFGLFNLL
jgi:hypothetical protein